MRVMVFFSLQPIDRGQSMSDEIAQAVQTIRNHGLQAEVGPTGTTIFGEMDEIFDAIQEVHEDLGADGSRINSELVIDAKPDLNPGEMQGRVDRVKERLEEPPAV